ncbi:MAG: NAD-dependent epimerase/dehydratase family protein [Verrucomicrobiales bacterium]|nr:NAD-dependent epimerase/dehydratase family protein [Verrucomicrobiales bacterium]
MKEGRLLVAGSGGFIGRHFLQGAAFARNIEVTSVGRAEEQSARHIQMDCGDLERLGEIIEEVSPTHLINFSGNFAGDYETQFHYNVEVSRTILESACRLNHRPRVILIGSAAEYGLPEQCPLNESSPLNPVSDYGRTKLMQTALAESYQRSKNQQIEVILARLFNVVGRGASESLLFGSLTKQITRLENGGVIQVGNLETKRDFVHVRDVIDSFDRLLTVETPSPCYLVSGGRAISIQSLVTFLIEASGKRLTIETDPGRLKSHDVPSIYGSSELLFQDTGWLPQLSPEKALEEMIGGRP